MFRIVRIPFQSRHPDNNGKIIHGYRVERIPLPEEYDDEVGFDNWYIEAEFEKLSDAREYRAFLERGRVVGDEEEV